MEAYPRNHWKLPPEYAILKTFDLHIRESVVETKVKLEKEISTVMFDWHAFMEFLMKDCELKKRIGPAWLLLFDIYLNADKAGIYSTTYANLPKRYGVSRITVKKWRRHLSKGLVIESFNKGNVVIFRLLEPYQLFLKPRIQEKPQDNTGQLLHGLLEVLKKHTSQNQI